MWTALVWNMGLGSPGKRTHAANWARLDQLMLDRSIDVALLSEAPTSGLAQRRAIYSEAGTLGWDVRRDNGEVKPRRWSAAVVTSGEMPEQVNPVATGSHGRRPNVPFRASKPGTWAAGRVAATGIGSVTCVSLYGLMDELSDASVHRSLSDISPIFTDPNYMDLVLVGGDLNTGTQWEDDRIRARDRNLLDRFEVFGLVDCLRKRRGPGRLSNCDCPDGDACQHTWTRLDPSDPGRPLQVDYLFASASLADRLESCEALSPPDWQEFSDHAPIIATFGSIDG
jgi:hypothetical protein